MKTAIGDTLIALAKCHAGIDGTRTKVLRDVRTRSMHYHVSANIDTKGSTYK
jgi:hypothetical protein